MRYAYPCIPHPETGGGFHVTFPDVPGALTSGATEAEALELAEDALVAILAARARKGLAIPLPGAASGESRLVPVPPGVAAKLALHDAMREQGLTVAALGERLGLGAEAVRELLDPDQRSDSGEVARACEAVGQRPIAGGAPA